MKRPLWCTRCGYDLSASAESPTGLKCPECGNTWLRGLWGDPVCHCRGSLRPTLFRPRQLQCSRCDEAVGCGELGISARECTGYLWRNAVVLWSAVPLNLILAFLIATARTGDVAVPATSGIVCAVAAPAIASAIVFRLERRLRLRQRLVPLAVGALCLNVIVLFAGGLVYLMAHFAG